MIYGFDFVEEEVVKEVVMNNASENKITKGNDPDPLTDPEEYRKWSNSFAPCRCSFDRSRP